ncbi:amino acid ABC transporter substrate-binding protein, partial [Aquitalea sp. S1-19]|nr:amino acid ABC transporter substrate-binding protein [Aquitalea sp. S1-19]
MLPILLGTVQAASSTPQPLRIGVTGAFTGNSSPMGLSMREGIRLATEEINSQGGIGGRILQLVERDDAGQNERGIRIAH